MLALLWAEGLPAREIGEKIGVTKNAVLGRAHRTGLPPRAVQAPRVPKTRQAVAASPNAVRYQLALDVLKKSPPVVRDIFGPYPVLPRVYVKPQATLPIPGASSPHRECQWTDSTRRPWVFCCGPTVQGRSWCAEHNARVFIS